MLLCTKVSAHSHSLVRRERVESSNTALLWFRRQPRITKTLLHSHPSSSFDVTGPPTAPAAPPHLTRAILPDSVFCWPSRFAGFFVRTDGHPSFVLEERHLSCRLLAFVFDPCSREDNPSSSLDVFPAGLSLLQNKYGSRLKAHSVALPNGRMEMLFPCIFIG